MKHIKKFENIEYKNIRDQIDEILDRLSKKKKLSKSEEEFMLDASNDNIDHVTTPSFTGNFWGDMSNPHNIGIMWMSDGVHKILKTIEEEEIDEIEKAGDSDKAWNMKQSRIQNKLISDHRELKPLLLKLGDIHLKYQSKLSELKNEFNKISSNMNDDEKYSFNQKIDYSFKGLESLYNQFGRALPELNDDKYKI